MVTVIWINPHSFIAKFYNPLTAAMDTID